VAKGKKSGKPKSTYFFEGKDRTVEELRGILEGNKELSRLKITCGLVEGKGNRILDVGCGIGHLGEMLKGKYSKFTGSDILKENIEIARKLATSKNAEYTTRSIFEKNAFRDSSFDYILLLELIEHIDNPGLYLQRCRELLKPKGYIIISTPNALSITNMLVNLKHRKRIIRNYSLNGTETDHVVLWDRQTLQNLLVKNGFRITRITLSAATLLGGQSLVVKARKT
jgi:2-polyprenyl-3-methyl-5-hydroxy-6-metoxy-1,4-benzoquinol methylase